ncbi:MULTISPECIES: NTP transferase domain-containing protein [Chryseobacterium]|uniref:Probable molybdenum cofactor guanylyltransferase n=1 Tax=Chryseobacterium camelliae TaxID=1265445 RepID=A0ABU0TIS6_9FLAO|nr:MULTISPECIES: NTP transferase domain-containing protein [Chryseobacterium]MDT3409246.1 molybdopterin-guanine dinucleotide biosynthesis protein A [Pseudacidovorax intermedius]MDQ1096891.1 molybdopterin-guanine dinucleotide biosynthesis protein A [Chryseobacterium camelliae]MDQ1100833.1 molybdopterin-guanine dinucleotide biosynthesis protein A [Chryseobacterium sp. SORGH_AS_1048]MDR6084275.1 molybdopterin-guanine dinucleotide biosynthesis protein A [Chryseobacterium sp. SORGH_AS_0909]MDR61325
MTLSTLPSSTTLNGLVLAGGKSSRMGIPKDTMNWHGKEQRYAAADLLANWCHEVYISCRPDQKADIDPAYRALTDIFSDMGPLSGILSAFQFQKDAAWLVVACDMPLLDKASLAILVRYRNTARIATTYESPADGFPEPLVTIWEPESYPLLTDFIHSGNRSPRRFLMQNDVLILKPEHPNALINTNTPEEADQVREMLKKRNMDGI